MLSGRVPARGEGAAVEAIPTPLDGMVTLRPIGLHRRGYELALRSRAGRLLRGPAPASTPVPPADYTVCGQSRLRLELTSTPPPEPPSSSKSSDPEIMPLGRKSPIPSGV